MSKDELDTIPVPKELAISLRKEIENSKFSLPEYYLFYLNKNISTLKKTEIVDSDSKIDKINFVSSVMIYKGEFTLAVIKEALYKKRRGTPDLIKAILIAHYDTGWSKVYRKYYDNMNNVKPEFIEINELKNNNKEKQKREKIRRIILKTVIVLAFLLLSSVISYLIYNNNLFNKKPHDKIYSNTPFDTTKGSYNVLLFPFQPLGMGKHEKIDIENTIITRLLDMSDKDSLNLKIKFDTVDCVKSYSEADSIGKKLNANLIIWGDLYESCTNNNEACLKFVNISSKDRVPDLKTEDEPKIEKILSLSEVAKGKLQRNVDYIIYWVAGSRSYDKQKYNKALAYFKKIEKSYTITAELYSFIGDTYYLLKNFKETKIYYNKALKINPNFPEVLNNYSALLLEKEFKDSIGAKKQIETAIKIYPYSDVEHTNYAILLENKFNDPTGAKEHYEKALKINPNNGLAHFYYANLLKEKYKDYLNAKIHYKKALEINPNSDEANFAYAMLLDHYLHDPEGAEIHYQKTLEINPNYYSAHIAYSSLFIYKYHDLEKARMHIEQALKINPKSVEAQIVYADFLYGQCKNFEEAKIHFEEAITLEPNYALAHYEYALFLKNGLKDIKKAKVQYNEAIRLDPTIVTIIDKKENFGIN